MEKPSKEKALSEGETVKAPGFRPCKPLLSVAREDRDGGSRYRASKMSGFPDN